MYREPAKPEPTAKAIVLPRHRVQRVILGVCLWFLNFWFLIWPVAWVVKGVVSGEDLWRVAVAPFLWLAIVGALIRVMRFDQVTLRAEGISRAGFFRDATMPWADVRAVEPRTKHRSRGGPVRLYAIIGDQGEMLVAPDILVDPELNLRWALDRAVEGELRDIEERVRTHGVLHSAWRQRLTHVGIALALSVGVGAILWSDESRREAERAFARLDGEPYEAKVAGLEALFEDDGLEARLRCRAGSRLTTEATWHGELERAATWCEAMGPIGCDALRYGSVDCESAPFAVLSRVREALAAGDADGALALLGALRFQGAVRDALEVRALRESGSPGMARVVAERCVDRYGESEDPVIRGFADQCREAL